jgi:GR25 family glycosyltransferase involved in LPS biosynthesis
MKRLILSAFPRGDDLVNEYIIYCDLLRKANAESTKSDYIFFRCGEKVEERHSRWIQIPLIRKYIDQYDEILWLDADVVIKDPTVNLFEVLKNHTNEITWKYEEPFVFVSKDTALGKASSSIALFDNSNKQKISDFLNDWWNDVDGIGDSHSIAAVWNNNWPSEKQHRIRVCDLYAKVENLACPFFQVHAGFKLIRTNLAKKHFYKLVNKKSEAKKIGLVMRKQNFYSNGAGQNCIFMKHTIEAAGYDVNIITNDIGGSATEEIPYIFHNFEDINIDEYMLFIFGSQVLLAADVEKIKRRGIRCVMFNPANVVDGFHQEHFLYSEKSASTPLFEMNFHTFSDEVWSLESHFESSFDYLQIINRQKIPILQVPLIWSPLFLFKDYKIFAYQQRKPGAKVDLIILEPNSSYCKSGWLPLMICEKFHLDKPDAINKVYLFNGTKLNKTAVGMINSLKLFEDKKIRLMERMPINDIISFFSDPLKNGGNHVVFVSHNINVPLNYAYFDALYAGFPLIHNSTYLVKENIGFYYDRLFDGAQGIDKSITDFNNYEYLCKSRKYLSKFDDYNSENIKKLDKLIAPQQLILSSRIIIYIITTNKEREKIMTQMMTDLKLPYEYVIFQGHTPADSKDYLDYRHEKYNEPDTLICCSRSHISAIKSFADNHKNKEYLLVIEDDVRLLKENFVKELEQAIDLWEKHGEIDYLNIGYLPGKRSPSAHSDKNLFWGLSAPRTGIWGTQAYLIKRSVAKQMAEVLFQPSAKKLYDAVLNYLYTVNKGVANSNKVILLSPDHFIPICWRQGYIEPMLANEDALLVSSINDKSNSIQHSDEIFGRDTKDFYKPLDGEPTLKITDD